MARSSHARVLVPLALAACLLAPGAAAQNCANTSTGLVPLVGLGRGLYMGFPGGLYADGAVLRPAAHDEAGLGLARAVQPLDPQGNPSPAGRIVLLSIGMSNTTQEFSNFVQRSNNDRDRSPAVVVVDGAQGGQSAQVIVNPNATFWTVVEQRLANAGVTVNQVQAIWMKEANPGPSGSPITHAQTLKSQLATICQIFRQKYPNVLLAFVSSRTYGGYAATQLNPEPYAYASGFSVQWLIQDQVNGDPALNYDPARGPVRSPHLSWGPYLWADGMDPRCDGLVWRCQDFGSDGTHPSALGREKVGGLLNVFFRTGGLTRSWYLRSGAGTTCPNAAAAECYGTGLAGAAGMPLLGASIEPALPSAAPFDVVLGRAAPNAVVSFAAGSVRHDVGEVPLLGGWLLTEPLLAWPGMTDGTGGASLSFGLLPAVPGACGFTLHFQAGIADGTAPQGIALTPGLAVRLGS